MSDRPILFSAPMVQALLTGRKTQTRRVIKPRTKNSLFDGSWSDSYVLDPGNADWRQRDVRYAPGDRLWVREAWQVVRETLDYETGGEFDVFAWDQDYGDPRNYLNGDARAGTKAGLYYAADGEDQNPCNFYPMIGIDGKVLREREIAWRPSIHMPRWASRLTLIVTDVRVQRVQEISEADARAEGVRRIHHGDGDYYFSALRDEPAPGNWSDPTDAFSELWDAINGIGAWAQNPWVVAVSFTVHRCNIDQMEAAQ